MSHPDTDKIQTIVVSSRVEMVEIWMDVNRCGDAVESFMMEWYPASHEERHGIRVITTDVFEDETMERFKIFGAVVGKLTFHG